MNRWALNTQTIGNGEPTFRVFLTITAIARATTSAVIVARRYMVAVATGRATSASRLNGVFRLAGAITARATSSIESTKYYAKYIAGAVTARATSVANWFAQRALLAVQTASATGTAVMYRGKLLDASVISHAITEAEIVELATNAPVERQVVLPYENRSVEVI